MKWSDLIETIMDKNNGIASLNLLYAQASIYKELPSGDWRKTLRGVLYREVGRGRFTKVGLGVYALPNSDSVEEVSAYSQALTGQSAEFYLKNTIDQHSAVEGMLIEIGNFLEYDTYSCDANKMFDGKRLGDLTALKQVPNFTYPDVKDVVARCDVIWFTRTHHHFPKYIFEVEVTTDFTKSMLKMYQLRHFDARFVLVAQGERMPTFLNRVEQEPFVGAKSRFAFRSFENVVKFYFSCVEYFEIRNCFLSDELM